VVVAAFAFSCSKLTLRVAVVQSRGSFPVLTVLAPGAVKNIWHGIT
jgi:hypothetical protein